MRILEKTVRVAAIALAVLVIGLSLCGVFGAWLVNRQATDVALKGFGVIETVVGVVDAGVGRADDLITKSRTEVRQAAETIETVGAKAQANSPVLKALSERLETSLAPRVAQMQQVLAPLRDAVGTVGNAVTMLNSLPIMADRAPRLKALDETFSRLEGLTADTTQLRATMKALVEQKGNVAAETVAALKGITQRIDTRLGEVQTNVQAVRADVAALQVRLDQRKSRLLFVFNLLAMLSTLMLAWIVYTQGVVIQHHRDVCDRLWPDERGTCIDRRPLTDPRSRAGAPRWSRVSSPCPSSSRPCSPRACWARSSTRCSPTMRSTTCVWAGTSPTDSVRPSTACTPPRGSSRSGRRSWRSSPLVRSIRRR